MSFIVLTGKRGSGKTALGVKRALDDLRKNRNVWVNFPIKVPKALREKCFFADSLEDIADMRNGTFILDEAHLKASSRNWKDFSPLAHACVSLSRHLGLDIVLISQNFRRLDSVLRELADKVFTLRKFGRLTIWKAWEEEDINELGRAKDKAKAIGRGMMWHTKKLHLCYDDKTLLSDLLRNRAPRHWLGNGRGIRLTRSEEVPGAPPAPPRNQGGAQGPQSRQTLVRKTYPQVT